MKMIIHRALLPFVTYLAVSFSFSSLAADLMKDFMPVGGTMSSTTGPPGDSSVTSTQTYVFTEVRDKRRQGGYCRTQQGKRGEANSTFLSFEGISSKEKCQDKCVLQSKKRLQASCQGIEYDEKNSRCEVWLEKPRKVKRSHKGVWCFTYGKRTADGGDEGGSSGMKQGYCRLEKGKREVRGTYKRIGVRDLSACKEECRKSSSPPCKGIEFQSKRRNGNCEIWYSEPKRVKHARHAVCFVYKDAPATTTSTASPGMNTTTTSTTTKMPTTDNTTTTTTTTTKMPTTDNTTMTTTTTPSSSTTTTKMPTTDTTTTMTSTETPPSNVPTTSTTTTSTTTVTRTTRPPTSSPAPTTTTAPPSTSATATIADEGPGLGRSGAIEGA